MIASPDFHSSSASESPESGYNSLTSDSNMQQEQSHWMWQNSLLHDAARGVKAAGTGSAANFLPSSSFTAPSLHGYDNIGQSSGLQNGSYADSLGATGGSIDFNPQQNERLCGMYSSIENGMQPFITGFSHPYQVLPSQAGSAAFSTSLHSARPNVPAPPPAPQASHRLKRKACDRAPWEDPEPVKIRVNEDRMASCLNDLNLDNNNSSSQPDLEDSAWYQPINDNEASYLFDRAAVADYFDGSSNIETLRSSDAHPHRRRIVITDKSTIEICPGLQVEPTSKDFIPKLIQDELNKANMQLAIWHPPESIFQSCANGGSSNADSSHKTQSSSSSSCTSSDSSDDERQNRMRIRCKQLNPTKESKAEEERIDLNDVSMDF